MRINLLKGRCNECKRLLTNDEWENMPIDICLDCLTKLYDQADGIY